MNADDTDEKTKAKAKPLDRGSTTSRDDTLGRKASTGMPLSELHDDGDGGRRDRDDHSDLQTDNPPDTTVHAVQTAVHTAQAITDLAGH